MPRRRKAPPRFRKTRLATRFAASLLLASVAIVLPVRFVDPPTTAFMLRDGLEHGRSVQNEWVPLAEISPHLAVAVIAAEDQKFPTHAGFDLDAIQDALFESRGRRRGASTISQQVAKNLFLWPGRSLVRKGLEAWLTLWIEQLLPKRRILEVHLNVAEFGPGVFGAEAASRRYFGRSARWLSPEQAALLAAVLPNPKQLKAGSPSPYVRQRAAAIRRAADRLGGSAVLRQLDEPASRTRTR